MNLTADSFEREQQSALKAFEKYVVCLDKTPAQFTESLQSLLGKAVKAYLGREPHLRHGIATDRHLTVIISQTESERPWCGIYFNLSSPYRKILERTENA